MDPEAQFGLLIDQSAALLGLPIDPEYRPAVLANFARIAELAALVMETRLPEAAEPAPVFVP